MRSWTNNTHLPDQHIKELGQFIHIGTAKDPSQFCNAIIKLPCWSFIGFIVTDHGPELQTVKSLSIPTYSFLTEKNGPFGIQFYHNGYKWREPAHEAEDNDRRKNDIKKTFGIQILPPTGNEASYDTVLMTARPVNSPVLPVGRVRLSSCI